MIEPTRYWIVLTHPLASWPQIADRLSEHTDYLEGLAGSGQALASGPFIDDSSPRGEGLTILRAGDEIAARALADADPLVRAGLWHMTVRRWQINQIAPSSTL